MSVLALANKKVLLLLLSLSCFAKARKSSHLWFLVPISSSTFSGSFGSPSCSKRSLRYHSPAGPISHGMQTRRPSVVEPWVHLYLTMSFSNWPPSNGAAFRSARPPLAVNPPTRPISIEATSGAPLPDANEVSSLSCASAKGVLTKLTLILGLTLAYSLAQIFPPSSHHQNVISVTAVSP